MTINIPQLISAAKDRTATLKDGEALLFIDGKLVQTSDPSAVSIHDFCIAVGGDGEAIDWRSVEEALHEMAGE